MKKAKTRKQIAHRKLRRQIRLFQNRKARFQYDSPLLWRSTDEFSLHVVVDGKHYHVGERDVKFMEKYNYSSYEIHTLRQGMSNIMNCPLYQRGRNRKRKHKDELFQRSFPKKNSWWEENVFLECVKSNHTWKVLMAFILILIIAVPGILYITLDYYYPDNRLTKLVHRIEGTTVKL